MLRCRHPTPSWYTPQLQRKGVRVSPPAVVYPLYRQQTKSVGMKRLVTAAVTYFLLVFAAGFLLGVLRVSWLVPAMGVRYAELVELPVMLLVSYFAAGFVVRRWSMPYAVPRRLVVGLLALLLLLAVEFTVVLQLRGMTVNDWLTHRDAVSGAAYYLSLLIYGAMPLLVRRT